jgi:TRAP-type mannitol/chloroaromatic compound transport system permease large subunit
MELAILLITVFVLLVIGSPVTVAPGVGSLIFILMEGTPSVVVLHRMVSGIDSFPLIAVPFFILAGHLMNSAAILMIVASATIFAWILIDQQVAVMLGDALLGFSQNKTVILIIIMMVVLLIGCFIETIAAITILVPVLLPIAEKVGIDPVHLGIIVILNLMLGLLTPPVGMVLCHVAAQCRIQKQLTSKIRHSANIGFLVKLLLHLLFLYNTINSPAVQQRAATQIIRQASRFCQIARGPAGHQSRLSNKRSAHGKIIGVAFVIKFFGQLQ